MAGILNSKQRIMDVLITNNGRRQIADGQFKIEYASFSDHGMFYRDDGSSIADDAGSRLMFEAYSTNTDIVIPEINSSNAISMDTSSGKNVINGHVTSDVSISGKKATFLSGAVDIYSSSNEIIQTAIDNFDNLQIIGTHNSSTIREYFNLSNNEITFTKVEKIPKNLDNISAIWGSETTNSQPQFKYMAPIYQKNNSILPMAIYPKLTSEPIQTFSQLKEQLDSSVAQKETIDILTSDSITNLLIQCFEIKESEIKKLAMVNYGSYYDDSGKYLGTIFHLGKVFRDTENIPKFIRLITLLFE